MSLSIVPSGLLQVLHRLQSLEARVSGTGFLPWLSSLLQLQDQLRFGITLVELAELRSAPAPMQGGSQPPGPPASGLRSSCTHVHKPIYTNKVKKD